MLLLITNTAPAENNDVAAIELELESLNIAFSTQVAAIPADVPTIVHKIDITEVTAVAVYGGDGTVAPVLKAVSELKLPVLILPGGTDNSIARTSGTPQEWRRSLKAYADGRYLIRHYPLAFADIKPFAADMHFGWAASALNETPAHLKRYLGRFAYTVHAIRMRAETELHTYSFVLDGKEYSVRGYSCFIANLGNPQLPGMSLFRASRRGVLRIAVLRRKTTGSLLRWYLLRKVGLGDHGTVLLKNGRSLELLQTPERAVIDEQPVTLKFPLKVRLEHEQIRIIVPVAPRLSWASSLRWLQTAWYRNTDQLRRHFTGIPSERFSLIGPHLYLGGQYGKNALSEFKRRGITGIVSMRTFVPEPLEADADIDILHLPTTDLAAPKLEDLQKGVNFITKHIEAGGMVYVHCRQGEGRGPTMAAAYLISKGMRPQDAIAHLQAFRPFANPTKPQRKRLIEFFERQKTR